MKIFKSPLAMFVGILLGILLGIFAKPIVPYIKPLADIYMSLLQMCILPIVACTICINIGNVFSGKIGKEVISRWIASITVTLFLAAVIGAAVSIIAIPFITPSTETKGFFAQMQSGELNSVLDTFIHVEFYNETAPNIETVSQISIVDFLVRMIPTNIFDALATGQTIQVILFFCVLGVMMTKIEKNVSSPIINALDGIYVALCGFIDKLMILLPVAICAMFAVQFSDESMLGIAGPLFRLILVLLLSMLIIIIISAIVIQYTSRCTLSEHWLAVKRTLLIALGTRSSLATVPVALEDFPTALKLNKTVANAILPISITMCQAGVIASGAVAAVFATTIYDVSINITTVMIIIIGSILFSISIVGVPGLVAVNMLSIILEPMGIPPEVIIVVYLAIIPVFDPICVFAGVYANFAVSSIVIKSKRLLHIPVILALLIFTTACGNSAAAFEDVFKSSETEDIYIGMVYPIEMRDEDTYFRNGFEFAINQINAEGGVLGKQLKVVERDDKSDSTTAMQIAQTFHEQGITAVVGHWTTDICYFAADIYEENNVIMVTPDATGMKLFDTRYEYIFRMIANNQLVSEALADYSAANGFERIAIYYDDNEYGSDFALGMEAALNKRGIDVIDRVTSIAPSNVKTILERWNAFGCDGIFFASSPPNYVEPIQLIRKEGNNLPIFGADNFDHRFFLSSLEPYTDNIYITSYNPEAIDAEFLEAYEATYGRHIDSHSIYGYESVYLIKNAIEATGTLDGKALAEYLSSLEDYRTISGTYTYNNETQEFDGFNISVQKVES